MRSQGRHHAACAGASRGSFTLPGTSRKYQRAIPFDIQHVELDVGLDLERQRVSGTATLHFIRRSPTESTLSLDALAFRIRQVEVDTGRGFGAARHSYDDETLEIQLNARAKGGRVRIRYEAEPQRGLYFLKPDAKVKERPLQVWSQCQDEDARHWFPCHDKPNVKSSFRLRVSVPRELTVLCNGERESPKSLQPTKKDGGAKRSTFVYHIAEAIPSYLVSLVAGRFEILQDRAAVLPSGRQVPIEYWVPPGSAEAGWRAFSETPTMVELFSRLTGLEYPYSRYTQVVVSDFVFGGMENATATTMYEHILLDEAASLDIESHDLVAHELAHHWFGDWVTCRDWPHAWLNEGFATFFEHIEQEHRQGREEYLLGLERDLVNYLREAASRYSRAVVSRDYEEPLDLFDRHLYEKGGLILHMLRQRLGDSVFFSGVQAYLAKHGGGHAETLDLQRAMEASSGQSLERFFDDWVHRPGHPIVVAKASWQNQQLKVSIQQKTTRHFALDVEVEVLLANGRKQLLKGHLEQSHLVLTLACTERPQYAAVDPNLQIIGQLQVDAPLPMLRNQLKLGTSARIRRHAAKSLRGKHDFKTREALQKQLGSAQEHWSVRSEAARSLGALGTETAFKALASALPVEHPKVRAAVAESLGAFRTAECGAILLRLLKREPSYLVQAAANRSLGKSSHPRALAALKRGLKSSSWADVVACAAAEGIAASERPQLAELLQPYLQYGVPTRLRRSAVSAYARLVSPAEALRKLEPLLEDPHPHFRSSVVGALEGLRTQDAEALLRQHSEAETDARVLRRTKEAIALLSQRHSHRQLTSQVARLEQKVQELSGAVAEATAKKRRGN